MNKLGWVFAGITAILLMGLALTTRKMADLERDNTNLKIEIEQWSNIYETQIRESKLRESNLNVKLLRSKMKTDSLLRCLDSMETKTKIIVRYIDRIQYQPQMDSLWRQLGY